MRRPARTSTSSARASRRAAHSRRAARPTPCLRSPPSRRARASRPIPRAIMRRRSRAPRVIGVEPSGADDAARSLRAGRIIASVKPETIADGLRATLGERPFAVIRNLVDDITTVTDPLIVRAMRRLFEVMKIVVEPSGAVPYAALLDA